MEKYKFENNKAVVDLPCIITISKSSVSIEHASNTDSVDIPNAGLTIQVGNVESYNPTNLSPEPEPEIIPNPTKPDESGEGESGGGNSGGQEGGGDNPDTPVNPDPTPSGSEKITFRLVNNSGVEARFNGKITLNLWNDVNYLSTTAELEWTRNVQVECTFTGGQKSNNYIRIPAGETKDFDILKSSMVYKVHHIGALELSDLKDDSLYGNVNYLDGSWYLKRNYNPRSSGAPTYIYTLMCYGKINHKDDDTHSSNGMYNVGIASPAKLEAGKTYTITINSMNSEASFDNSKHYMILV